MTENRDGLSAPSPDHALAAAGVISWGLVLLSALTAFLPPEGGMRVRFDALRAQYDTALVAAFPLWRGQEDSHLAVCARGKQDYVQVGKVRLNAAFAQLTPWLGIRGHVTGNGWPLPVVAAARLAGVGLEGRHGLCIVPPYGSYVFLSAIVFSLPEAADIRPVPRQDSGRCGGCAPETPACHAACPTGALRCERGADGPRRVLDRSRCISSVNQKKGAFTPEEAQLVHKSPYVWGCDLCQMACPYNRAPKRSPLAEFAEDRALRITAAEVESGRHDGRSFVRGGNERILRNLEL